METITGSGVFLVLFKVWRDCIFCEKQLNDFDDREERTGS